MASNNDPIAVWWERRWQERRAEARQVDWATTASQADAIVAILDLTPGQRILDIACGAGALDVELATRGLVVTGLDICPAALEIARSLAEERSAHANWICADMRDLPLGPFDAILLWDVLFGILPSDAENQRVLNGAARILCPGGRFYLEVYTKEFALRHGVEGNLVYSPDSDSFVSSGGERRLLPMRLYTGDALERMLESAGLRVIAEKGWGWRGDPPGPPYRGRTVISTGEDSPVRQAP
ncbi:MAG: class I SAM-dependent methyltransferase [Armatimonadota bacterium]|nr:MAG: class I SAM-dependent methyltransferase [Armatimonadota bacterium]